MKKNIMIMLFILTMGGISMSAEKNDQSIFEFNTKEDLEQWMVINDTVMGGISQSSLQLGEQGSLVFSGSVSLENYGGFCSTSSQPVKNHDLSTYDGIALRLKGDGKKYKVMLKTDAAFSGFAYQYAFGTKENEWITVRAPFEDFVPVFRGVVKKNIEKIDRSKIKSFGFLIADKQAGPFRLEVNYIKAFRKD